jgi:hypothetical protein
MVIGWLTCIPAVLLPHSLCRSTTANAPADRQMPIASVVRGKHKNKKKDIETIQLHIISDTLCEFNICPEIQINFNETLL